MQMDSKFRLPLPPESTESKSSSRHPFESDDFIAIRRVKDKKIRMGLVTKTFDSESETSSEEDEGDDEVDKLKPGQIKVEWYPTGRETKILQQRAFLLDRALLKGEIVNRKADPNRKIGQVVDMSVVGDLAVLPKKQTVIKGVDISRLAFVRRRFQQYDTESTSPCKIIYGAWTAELVAAHEKVFIRSAKGYKGFIWSHDGDEIVDATHGAEEGSTFDSDQWYPGQPLVVPSECLNRVEWTQGCKPPDRFLRRMASSRSPTKFTVEKIVLDSIEVHWVAPISGCSGEASKICPPENRIRGEELKKVRKMESSEFHAAQIGDRMIGRVEPTDVVMSERDWQENLYRNFEIIVRHVDDPEEIMGVTDMSRNGVPPSRSSDQMDTPRSSVQESEDQYFTASEYSGKFREFPDTAEDGAEVQLTREESESIPSSANQPISDAKVPSRSGADGRARISSVTLRTVRKMFSSAGKTAKRTMSRRRGKKDPGTEKKNRKIDTLEVSGTYVGELIFARSYLDVMWQDGHLEKRIPSVQLAYNEYDLDQHQYWPGSFVLLNGEKKKWPENGYGIVIGASSEDKIATVAWYEVSAYGGEPQLLKTEKDSAYELSVHPDYDFVPGQCVMRVGEGVEMEESGGSILANIGQIILVQADMGKVSVRWMDCRTGLVWPTEIVRLFPSDIEGSLDGDDSLWESDDDSSPSGSDDQWATGSESSDEEVQSTSPLANYAVCAELKDVVSCALESLKSQMNLLYSMEQHDAAECLDARVTIMRILIQFRKDLLKRDARECAEVAEFAEETKPRVRLIKFWLKLVTGKKNRGLDRFSETERRNIILEKSAVAEEVSKADSSDSVTEGTHLFEQMKELRLKFLKRILNDLSEDCGDYISEMKTDPRSSQCLACVDMITSRLMDVVVKFFKQVLESAELVNALDSSLSQPLSVASSPPDSPSYIGGSGKDVSAGAFEVLDKAPSSHSYFEDKWKPVNVTQYFLKAVRKEMTVMHTSLPTGIFVKGYEDRTDLFSCMIIGPKNTPFVDGIFLFDVNLPQGYPLEPPLVYYKSYSSEQLNPNLYQNGKVCVSLLGTWSGKSSEVWNPGSNLLQVFVSIQGLILNSEPYFNEAGYESRRAVAESVERSRRYNESALIRNIENLTRIAQNPPNCFKSEIARHMKAVGMKLFTEISLWMDGEKESSFPLQPISAGCKLSAARHLEKLRSLCNEEK